MPAESFAPPCAYTVKPGDTLWAIAEVRLLLDLGYKKCGWTVEGWGSYCSQGCHSQGYVWYGLRPGSVKALLRQGKKKEWGRVC